MKKEPNIKTVRIIIAIMLLVILPTIISIPEFVRILVFGDSWVDILIIFSVSLFIWQVVDRYVERWRTIKRWCRTMPYRLKKFLLKMWNGEPPYTSPLQEGTDSRTKSNIPFHW